MSVRKSLFGYASLKLKRKLTKVFLNYFDHNPQ